MEKRIVIKIVVDAENINARINVRDMFPVHATNTMWLHMFAILVTRKNYVLKNNISTVLNMQMLMSEEEGLKAEKE